MCRDWSHVSGKYYTIITDDLHNNIYVSVMSSIVTSAVFLEHASWAPEVVLEGTQVPLCTVLVTPKGPVFLFYM